MYSERCAGGGSRALVLVQLPLDLGETSVPAPDVAVIAGRPEDYMTAHPTTALLVIEVAESSLIQDRLTKAPLYAAAGIPEYWVVNLRDRCVEVYRRPIPAERRYDESRIARLGDALDAVALPAAGITVAEIFRATEAS